MFWIIDLLAVDNIEALVFVASVGFFVLGFSWIALNAGGPPSSTSFDDTIRQKKWRAKPPPRVRSYIPYIGSAMDMGTDIEQFHQKYFDKFNTPIFTAVIAGDVCHFLAPQDHLHVLFRTKQLDDRLIQKQFVCNALGCSEEFANLALYDDVFGKPYLDQYQKYLFTTNELNHTIQSAQDCLNEKTPTLFETGSAADVWNRLDLLKAVSAAIFEASVQSLISKHVATKECRELFDKYDSKIALFHSGVPPKFFKEAYTARETLLQKIMEPEFAEGASRLMKARLELDKKNQTPRAEKCRFYMGIMWASVGNSIPAVFWLLYYLMKNKDAYYAIQKEVDLIVSKRGNNKGTTKTYTIEELDQMPALDSAFTETLRLQHGAFTLRNVTEDFEIDLKQDGKYFLEKGSKVMVYMAMMHHDESIFSDADKFVSDRFMPKDGSGKKPSFSRNGKSIDPLRFFGGGAHMCPGRKFILYEAKAFIAALMTSYDMRLVNADEPVIGHDKSYQGIGVNKPEKDVEFEIRRRVKPD